MSQDTNNLTSCPMCGAQPIEDGKSDYLSIRCESCDLKGPTFDFDGDDDADIERAQTAAAEHWNRRASQPVAAPGATAEPGPLNTLLQIAQFMDENSRPQQTGVDSFDYASEFDYNLSHAANTIRCIVADLESKQAEAAPAPTAEPVAWMVPISGVYEYFATRAAAVHERAEYEREMASDPDLEHVEPEPLYVSPLGHASPAAHPATSQGEKS